MTNSHRGEVALPLAGHIVVLAPSFALIAELEEALGPLPALLRRLAAEADWRAGEVAGVLRLALAHAPGAPAAERIEPLLLAAGLAELRPVAVELLLAALAGSEPAAAAEALPGKPPAASTGGG